MKKLLTALAVLATALSCTRKPVEDPMFWTWLEDIPSIDMEQAFTHAEEAGLDAVMLHAASAQDYVKDIEIARRHGIRVYAWVWTLNPPRQERPQMLEEHPDWFSVNRLGESVADHKAYVNSYKFLCPALPEVREYLQAKVAEICAIDGIEGICLDYCRLIDCVLPVSLAYNYNLFQDTEVFPEYDYGYHPAMLEKFAAEYGYNPLDREDPSRDAAWCTFRSAQITEVANLMCDVAHKAGKKVTASPFAAAGLANFMVFQDWPSWKLDMVHPMAYTDFYTMDASFAYDATLSNVAAAPEGITVMCGVDTELGGDPAWIFDKMDAAFAAGAQGISLYTIEGLNTPELRAEFKEYANRLRKMRSEGRLPKAPGVAPDTDPFHNERLMAVVQRNMQRVIAGEPIHVKSVNGMVPDQVEKQYPELDLTPYKLVKETDRLKVYEVTDKASGTTLNVFFILYGNIVSGWDVRAVQ